MDVSRTWEGGRNEDDFFTESNQLQRKNPSLKTSSRNMYSPTHVRNTTMQSPSPSVEKRNRRPSVTRATSGLSMSFDSKPVIENRNSFDINVGGGTNEPL
ncbi:hypothetical protein LTS18_004214, partial [Coniosporium uncinatum]